MSWTEAEARRQLAALEASGLSVVEFCERAGVSPQRIWYWRARLRAAVATEPQLPQLVEVALRPSAAEGSMIVLEFPSGHVLRVSASVGVAEVLVAAGLAAC